METPMAAETTLASVPVLWIWHAGTVPRDDDAGGPWAAAAPEEGRESPGATRRRPRGRRRAKRERGRNR
jgi:hypothetical protein